jgi:hypothetical protein
MAAISGTCMAAVALIFVVAGISKLLVPAPTSAALRAVDPRLERKDLTFCLGTVELALAVSIVLIGGMWVVALALAALLVFTAFLVFLARQPDPVSCGCIGDGMGDETGQWGGLMRNGLMFGLLVLGSAHPGPPDASAFLTGLQLALAVLLLSEGGATVRAIRQARGAAT